MLGAFYYLLILLLAFPLRTRFHILRGWSEPSRTVASIAVVQYLGTWLAFLCYFVFGMGMAAFSVATIILIMCTIYLWDVGKRDISTRDDSESFAHRGFRVVKENSILILFVLLFSIPFVFGLSVGHEGQIYFRFNFIDTAFHLSLSQAFLTHPHFPPLDPNVAGQPLVYHFMSDFLVAFLSLGGLDLVWATHALNMISAVMTAVVLWGVVDRLLRHPRPVITGTACAMFCFMMPVLANALHWYFFKPAYFSGSEGWARLFFPYYNFENSILNLFEPQRAFPFSLPIIFLIIDALCMLWRQYRFELMQESVWLCALLPFSHMTSFIVLSGYFLLVLVRHRTRWTQDFLYFLLPGLIAALQILYTKGYAPAFTAGYSGWDAFGQLPLRDFHTVPALFQGIVYWLFVDGEFLILGAASLALLFGLRRQDENRPFFRQPILPLLAASISFFILINFYRFSRNWGDSNKFVMFLNFWISILCGHLLTVLWTARRAVGKALTAAVLSAVLVPYLFELQTKLHGEPSRLFSKADALAALWITQHTEANDIFVTTPLTLVDFVAALAGRGVLHGMYVNTHPYYDPRIENDIKQVYENAELGLLKKYSVKYVKVSAEERRRYHLNPIFDRPIGLVYSDGSDPYDSIRIYDTAALLRMPRR